MSKIQFIPGHETKLVSGGNDPFLLVWDYVSGTVLQKVDIPTLIKDVNPVVSMAFYKTVLVLALEKADAVQVWSVSDSGVLSFEYSLAIPSTERVFCVAFDSTGCLWMSGLQGVYCMALLPEGKKDKEEWSSVSSLSQVSPLSKGYGMEDVVEYRKRATQWEDKSTEEKKEKKENKAIGKKRKRPQGEETTKASEAVVEADA